MSVVHTQLKIVYNIHETALNYTIKCFFLIKIMNAWVLIFCLTSLEIVSPSLSAPAGANKTETTT